MINGYWKKINKCLILITEVACEDKAVTVHDFEGLLKSGGISPLVLKIDTRFYGWSTTHRGRFTPENHRIGGLGGPIADVDPLEKK